MDYHYQGSLGWLVRIPSPLLLISHFRKSFYSKMLLQGWLDMLQQQLALHGALLILRHLEVHPR